MIKFLKRGLLFCLMCSMLCFCYVPAFAKEKSYYEITENTCDDLVNLILLGGGGDNKVFKDGKDYGRVNKDNIISALDKDKINVLAGHSTGANQIELFIKDGSLEDYIDIFVLLDAQAFVEEDRYCLGDTKHPVIICVSDQLNRVDAYIMKTQYSNNELYYMIGMKHVDMATDHFDDVIDIIHNYLERHEISSVEEISKSLKVNTPEQELIDLTVWNTWNDGNNQDGKRPGSITVTLYAGSTQVESQIISPDNKGLLRYTFKGLPKYKDNIEIEYHYEEKNLPTDKNGIPVDYNIQVQRMINYTTVTKNLSKGFLIRSSHTPEVVTMWSSINWLDRNNLFMTRPEEITVSVMNGETVVAKKVVTAEDGWSCKFENLPKYSNGEIINYSFAADEIEGYSLSVSGRSITYTRLS